MSALLTDASLREFEKFLDSYVCEGLWRFEKELRAFIELHGWETAAPLGDPLQFSKFAASVRTFASRRSAQALRFQQLHDGKYKYWVYRANGCEVHALLDGLAVTADHPFWDTYFPANGWHCCCEAYGARNDNGILRLGGDPSKLLPESWHQLGPDTGTPLGIDPGFVGPVHPDMRFFIERMMQVHAAHTDIGSFATSLST